MSSATFAGTPDTSGSSGFCSGPAPPPPPPPPVPGQMPAMKIDTVDTPYSRRPQLSSNDPYEPPAAIQNAMMTKDKKPFTYTPGMGGKLDLSQIRSPRMARRVAKNANDEGIDGPPKSPLAAEQPRPVSTCTNLFIQPQVAVPVFPTGNLPSTPITRGSQRSFDLSSQPNTPDTPTTPPQVVLAKAPTPWLQNKNKSQEELPEWAKRSGTINGSTSPPSTPPAATSTAHISFIQAPPLQNQINSPRQQSQQRIQMRPVPVQSPERVVPIQIEDRPSVFTVINEPGHHHQLQNSTPNYQQRWGNSGPPSPPVQATRVVNAARQQPQSPGTFIVPMVVEGNNFNSPSGNTGYQQQQGWDYGQSVPAQNQIRGNGGQQRGPISTQQEPGPVQSRSFRVLQKITDTDDDNIDPEQIRKLQLTEDDKVLMNKFKEQVDGDTYLHQEEDPRYRGAAIPSRAFRYLQNMTDVGDGPTNVTRGVNNPIKRQNRNSQTFAEEVPVNLPASEQQVQEPKKYTGSAIPSRSFKILQAMTTPESLVKKQESRQADITCRSENNMMPLGNQQSVIIPRYPQPIYWAYYPIPYSSNQLNYNYHQNQYQTNIDDQMNPSFSAYYGHQDDNNISCYNLPTFYDQQFYEANNFPAYGTSENYYNYSQAPTWMIEAQPGVKSDSISSTLNDSSSILADEKKSTENQSAKTNDNENEKKIAPVNYKNEDLINEEKNPLDEANDETKNLKKIDVESDEENSEEVTSELSELSSAENCQIDENSSNSSESSDSDSYLAYSTGINLNKNHDDKILNDDKQVSTDCESYSEEEEEEEKKEDEIKNEEKIEIKELKVRSDTPNLIDEMGWKNIPEEDEDIPAVVSVSLPFRCQLSSLKKRENIVDSDINNSTIKLNKKIPFDTKEVIDSVSLSLRIDREPTTTVDFTLRKSPLTRPKTWCVDRFDDDFWTSKTILGGQESVDHEADEQNKEIIISKINKSIEKEEENDEEETKDLNEKKENEIKSVPSFEVTAEDDHNDDNDNKNNNDNDDGVDDGTESADESKKNKCLLNVQNSRDETDDDDSGVTSDMSRLISEVDTDSECTPSRKIITYKRTQTHSRLFRLLSEDLTQDNIEKDKSKRRNRLSLPIKNSTAFNYDYSNQSSGLTSPSEYSPVNESSCKNFQKITTEQITPESSDKDQYFRVWKNGIDEPKKTEIISSLTGKFDDYKNSFLYYKTNVLCPRIKNIKNVPRSLDGRVCKPVTATKNYTKYDRS